MGKLMKTPEAIQYHTFIVYILSFSISFMQIVHETCRHSIRFENCKLLSNLEIIQYKTDFGDFLSSSILRSREASSSQNLSNNFHIFTENSWNNRQIQSV